MGKWIKVVFFFLVPLLMLTAYHQSLLRMIGALVVYEKEDFDRVDAVIVPSGSIPDRVLQAADLLKQSRAETVFLFRKRRSEDVQKLQELEINFPQDHTINQKVLIKSGVKSSRIRVISEIVNSTWEEAQALSSYLADNPLDTIVIVTCRYHSYRAYLNFQRSMEKTGVEIYSVPSKYCSFQSENWWGDRDQIKVLFIELASLAAFFLGRR